MELGWLALDSRCWKADSYFPCWFTACWSLGFPWSLQFSPLCCFPPHNSHWLRARQTDGILFAGGFHYSPVYGQTVSTRARENENMDCEVGCELSGWKSSELFPNLMETGETSIFSVSFVPDNSSLHLTSPARPGRLQPEQNWTAENKLVFTPHGPRSWLSTNEISRPILFLMLKTFTIPLTHKSGPVWGPGCDISGNNSDWIALLPCPDSRTQPLSLMILSAFFSPMFYVVSQP